MKKELTPADNTAASVKKKKQPTSIQVPDALQTELSDAKELTGESVSSLFVMCAQKSLHEVVNEIMVARRAKVLAYYDSMEKRADRASPSGGVSHNNPTTDKKSRPKPSGARG